MAFIQSFQNEAEVVLEPYLVRQLDSQDDKSLFENLNSSFKCQNMTFSTALTTNHVACWVNVNHNVMIHSSAFSPHRSTIYNVDSLETCPVNMEKDS